MGYGLWKPNATWLGGEPGWWGGERGNFMYFKYNFSFSRQKIYIYASILTFRYASFGDDEIGKISYR